MLSLLSISIFFVIFEKLIRSYFQYVVNTTIMYVSFQRNQGILENGSRLLGV